MYKFPKISLLNSDIKSTNKCDSIIYDIITKEILLVKGYTHIWSLPKGGKKLNESNIECACRETKEETGIDIGIDIARIIKDSKNIKIKNTVYYIIPIIKKTPTLCL